MQDGAGWTATEGAVRAGVGDGVAGVEEASVNETRNSGVRMDEFKAYVIRGVIPFTARAQGRGLFCGHVPQDIRLRGAHSERHIW